jgi:hypothetical protein
MVDRLAYQLSVQMYYQQKPQRQTLLYLPHNASHWIPVI